MLRPCVNPSCSVQFDAAIGQCPSCGTPAPVDQNEAPPRGMWTGKQIVKSVICTGLGAAPGAVWLASAGTTQAAVILGLGTLIGFCLSLPGVSVGNVAAGTVGMIALKNTPHFMHEEITETFFGDRTESVGKEPEEQTGKTP